ncbi:unnamed protein product, partial [Prorocentrum cordatum]
MPMKRDPDGRGGRGGKRAKVDQTMLEVSLAEGSLQDWGRAVLSEFDEVLVKEEKFSSVSDYIKDYIFSDGGIGYKTFVEAMEEAFPELHGIKYSTEVVPGSAVFKLWQFGFAPEYGNSGLAPLDDMRTLITLICSRGFKTNSDMAGVEKIVACLATEQMLGTPPTTEDIPGEIINAGSIMEVKGWKRINAAFFIAVAVMRRGLLEDMRGQPEVYSTFRAVFANVKDARNVEDAIFANRE